MHRFFKQTIGKIEASIFVFPMCNQCCNRCIVVIDQAMEQTIIMDELLCFIANKLDIVTCDEIVSLCTTHFNDANIRQSKLTLFNVCQRGPDDDPPFNWCQI